MGKPLCSFDDIARSFAPGDHLFLPGCGSEACDLVTALHGVEQLQITTTFVPGINPTPIDDFAASTRVTGLFMTPALSAPQARGQYRHLPLSYAGFARYAQDNFTPDAIALTVSEPNAQGMVSLGTSVEFSALVLARAPRKIAVINPNMPYVATSHCLPLSTFDTIARSDTPLRTYDVGPRQPEAEQIATHLAGLIPDGAALQVGLGKVPDALFAQLHDRKGLRLHSGMFSDGVIGLNGAGALSPDWPHMTCALIGSPALYDWAGRQDQISVTGCEHTHDPARIAAIDGFITVNTALEVDLFGQCNLETANGRAVSSPGGAPDFARAGRMSHGGLSIVALPSSFAKGTQSRITAAIHAPGLVSLARYDIDMIITEHGIADLRKGSTHDRAEAIINIAAPAFRADLTEQWNVIKNRL
ncbi:acetyl-CoA hydrolase/transferase family protein [Thalassovita taeanensis]|uniref:Acyl-CoA hydrolase n=1 Tax=Thalassovita taeanensis TaxID=657014 RepID=A0A1H9BXN2_9RHOB|nr:acetyl-CoA hydrolase/transferase C-terminal domain-containing protein [Thalassovita taeanensis]SEP93511.1 Acyl-CoA hydrolase [Thalassovita taeanensis]